MNFTVVSEPFVARQLPASLFNWKQCKNWVGSCGQQGRCMAAAIRAARQNSACQLSLTLLFRNLFRNLTKNVKNLLIFKEKRLHFWAKFHFSASYIIASYQKSNSETFIFHPLHQTQFVKDLLKIFIQWRRQGHFDLSEDITPKEDCLQHQCK